MLTNFLKIFRWNFPEIPFENFNNIRLIFFNLY